MYGHQFGKCCKILYVLWGHRRTQIFFQGGGGGYCIVSRPWCRTSPEKASKQQQQQQQQFFFFFFRIQRGVCNTPNTCFLTQRGCLNTPNTPPPSVHVLYGTFQYRITQKGVKKACEQSQWNWHPLSWIQTLMEQTMISKRWVILFSPPTWNVLPSDLWKPVIKHSKQGNSVVQT